MEAGGVVTGTLMINGFTSPIITTVNNTYKETRSVVVEAINRMTKDTGVIAINTNDDLKGIRLEITTEEILKLCSIRYLLIRLLPTGQV